jgi:hypothetical protein
MKTQSGFMIFCLSLSFTFSSPLWAREKLDPAEYVRKCSVVVTNNLADAAEKLDAYSNRWFLNKIDSGYQEALANYKSAVNSLALLAAAELWQLRVSRGDKLSIKNLEDKRGRSLVEYATAQVPNFQNLGSEEKMNVIYNVVARLDGSNLDGSFCGYKP